MVDIVIINAKYYDAFWTLKEINLLLSCLVDLNAVLGIWLQVAMI